MYGNSTSVESSLIDSYAWDTIVNWMESEKTGIAIDSTNYGNYLNSSVFLVDGVYATHKHNFSNNSMSLANEYKRETIDIPARNRQGEQIMYEIATGSAEETKVLKIYDMAGNMWEWTTEAGNHDAGINAKQYAVIRGGSVYHNGDTSLSYRHGNDDISFRGFNVGFRVVLYVK